MLITEWCGIEELKSDEGWRLLQERRFGFRMASLSRYLWILTSQLKHHWRGTILSPQSTVNWWSTYNWFIIPGISTAEIRCPRYGLKISGDRKYLDFVLYILDLHYTFHDFGHLNRFWRSKVPNTEKKLMVIANHQVNFSKKFYLDMKNRIFSRLF